MRAPAEHYVAGGWGMRVWGGGEGGEGGEGRGECRGGEDQLTVRHFTGYSPLTICDLYNNTPDGLR